MSHSGHKKAGIILPLLNQLHNNKNKDSFDNENESYHNKALNNNSKGSNNVRTQKKINPFIMKKAKINIKKVTEEIYL